MKCSNKKIEEAKEHHLDEDAMIPHDVAPLELVGLGSSSSMESFASWRLMAAEWRRKKDDWRRHFKEKMSQEEAMDKSLEVGEEE